MTRRGVEIRVGFLVVLAALIAVVGTMWFQRFRIAEKRYTFHVRFEQVGGLVPGDPIHVNGVEHGKVSGVRLVAPRRVVVDMAVKEGVPIPDDSRVLLKSIGIMGERFVEISQGVSTQMLAAGDTIDGTFLMGMSEVMGNAGDILNSVAETARSLRDVAEILSSQGKLQETMDNLADATGSLREVTAGDDPVLVDAIVRFNRVATMMDSLVASNYASLDSSLAAFGRAGGRIEVTVDNLATVSDDLKDITRALREGDGTAGQLIYDGELLLRIETTVSRLDSLLWDIRERPERYVKFELF